MLSSKCLAWLLLSFSPFLTSELQTQKILPCFPRTMTTYFHNNISLSLSISLPKTHTHTLSLFLYINLSLSNTHTYTLFLSLLHTHTHSLSQIHTLFFLSHGLNLCRIMTALKQATLKRGKKSIKKKPSSKFSHHK